MSVKTKLISICAVLSVVSNYVAADALFTKDPVLPLKSVYYDLPKDEPVLVFVYRSTCPRSQATLPKFMKAAKTLESWGMKTASLEYNETGWEYMEVVFPLPMFPALVMYKGDGTKTKFKSGDPVYSKAEDFVDFAWANKA